MNLSLRLILAIISLTILIVIVGSALAVRNAKLSIQQELDKNSSLGLNLFSIAVMNDQMQTSSTLNNLFRQIAALDYIKTLNIAITRTNQTLIQFAPKQTVQQTAQVPNWFLTQVIPTPKEYHRRLILPAQNPITIRVIPDPAVEILKAWENLRLLFMLLLVFTALAIPVIWAVIKIGLKPLEQVLAGLDVIGTGDFKQRLPHFRLNDISRLSRRFNRMAEVLDDQKIENQLLHTQLLEVQENERRYLARELHDELGQSISGIKALAVSIEQRSFEHQTAMQSIRKVCDQMHAAVRNMINRLRPAVLDEHGLQVAVEKLIDDWNSYHEDTFCALHISGNLDSLEGKSAIILYRVIQESLTNVARHAKAKNVIVEVNASNAMLTLSIEDDGIGLTDKKHYRGRGLPGIKERIHAHNGTFEVHSLAHQGVKIIITLPIAEA